MGTYRSAIITAAGQNLVAESLTGGKAITFSSAKTSSYAYPGGTNLAELTDIRDIVQTEQPSMAQVINDNVVQVTARFSNENVENAYMIQTLGLYAKINDGDEVLFSVIQAITPDQMPAKNPVSPTAYIFNMQTAVQQAAQITVIVDPAGAATIQDIINLQQSKSYIQVIATNIPVENRADNAWYLYDTDEQTSDLTRHNVELQDRDGHAYYPHTSSSVSFRPDGTTVEETLEGMKEEIEGDNDKRNLQTYTSLEQLSLTAPQTVQQVYSALPDYATAIILCTGTSIVSDVPSDETSGIVEITKAGNGSMIRFSAADGTVYFGSLSDGAVKWLKALDAEQVLDTEEEVSANTNPGVPAGALVVKQVISEMASLNDNGAITGMDAREDGVYITYVPTAGADAVTKKLGDVTEQMAGTVLMAAKVGIYMQIANSDYVTVNSDGDYSITQSGEYTIQALHYPTGGSGSVTRVTVNGVDVIKIEFVGSVTQKTYTWQAKEGDIITFTVGSYNSGHIASSAIKMVVNV